MKPGFDQTSRPEVVMARIADLSPRTVIFDLEPYVATWNTNMDQLLLGLRSLIDQFEAFPDVRLVVATNSQRRLPKVASDVSDTILYISSAFKPIRMAPYSTLQGPGVVVGDQLATDGLLAWRLSYRFIQYSPNFVRLPLGAKAMNKLGKLIEPMFFDRRAG